LLRKTRELNINLSATLERALREESPDAKQNDGLTKTALR